MNISVLPRIPLNKKDTDENNGCPDNKMAFNPQMLRMTKDSKKLCDTLFNRDTW